MNRLLEWVGLRERERVRNATEKDTLVEETRGLRVAMDRVASELSAVAEAIRETKEHAGPSNIPWEDMARGRDYRRRRDEQHS